MLLVGNVFGYVIVCIVMYCIVCLLKLGSVCSVVSVVLSGVIGLSVSVLLLIVWVSDMIVCVVLCLMLIVLRIEGGSVVSVVVYGSVCVRFGGVLLIGLLKCVVICVSSGVLVCVVVSCLFVMVWIVILRLLNVLGMCRFGELFVRLLRCVLIMLGWLLRLNSWCMCVSMVGMIGVSVGDMVMVSVKCCGMCVMDS